MKLSQRDLWARPAVVDQASWVRPARRLSLALIGIGVALMSYPWLTDAWAAMIQGRLKRTNFATGLVPTGEPAMRLRIPRTGTDVVVVEGTTSAALRAGAGHYRDSAWPGDHGNLAIAGHRTTYGAPFADIDSLRAGDRIFIESGEGEFTYEVSRRPWTVAPNDWTPIRGPTKRPSLTLTSCHPEGSATFRIVVRAHLVQRSAQAA